ncbi:MAG: phosphatase PAP2 family protein [Gammaproteobacteria bacterium]
MQAIDYIVQLIISVFLIIGVYQFYFWCQRNAVTVPRTFSSVLDERLPFWPSWVWVYSFMYYPMILYVNFHLQSPREFLYVVASYLMLLAGQMTFFILYPIETPPDWRHYNGRCSLSMRFLSFVHSFDQRSNCFPSMHTSVAMLTALHLFPKSGGLVFLFPLVIGLSCLFTKQHYLVDVPAGAVLGWLVYEIFLKVC